MGAMDVALRLVISGDSTQAVKSLKDVGKAAGDASKSTSERFAAAGAGMESAGRSMSMGLTLPLLAVGAGAVKVAADFETSMNQVEAATGASADEMAKLSAYAQKMGAETMFSAGEAGDAMLELAKAGFTPAQIQGGALKTTMDLAAAGGLQLADAATVTVGALTGFNIKAADSAQVADALAGAANASVADVSDLSVALQQVGPGAANAGLSLQETAAVLGAFADNGIRGSDAGTSLKTMLARLVPQTDKQAAAMKRLGIDFTNADGSFKSISEIAQILQDKMSGLSDAQRTAAMNTLFGSDATRAATILMKEGAKGLSTYTEATNKQGNAAKMAEARTKGMGGALERMKGSIETAGITIGETLAPMVTKVAGALEKAANWVGGLSDGWRRFIVVAGLVVAAIGPMLVIFGKLFQSIQTGMSAVRTVGGLLSRIRGGGATSTPSTLGQGLPGQTAPGTSGAPGATGPNTSAIQRNTAAFERNTAALQRAIGASDRETAADNRAAAASNREAAADDRAVTAANLETAADRKSAAASTLAGSKLGGLGGKAGTAAGQVGGLGGASRNARGSILGMDKATAKSAATMAGLAIAVTFTMNQLSKLGNAIDQMNAAAKQAEGAKNDALANAEAQLARIKAKYGADSPQYAKFLKTVEAIRKQIEADSYKMPWWAKAGSTVKGGVGSAWNWAFGGAQASGGDYLVTKPTLFLAGEKGIERATFTPQGRSAPGGVSFNNCTFVAQDPRQLVDDVARGVERKLRMQAALGY